MNRMRLDGDALESGPRGPTNFGFMASAPCRCGQCSLCPPPHLVRFPIAASSLGASRIGRRSESRESARALQNTRRTDRHRRECAARMSRCALKSTEFVSAAQRRRRTVCQPAAQRSSSLREVDAHAGQEAAQAELDLDTLPLVTPDTLLELLIRALEPGQPRRQRVIAAADVVLVSYRAPQALVRVAAHRAMSGAGL